MTNSVTVTESNNAVTVTESNNAVTVTESNNTVEIVESAPAPAAPDPWYQNLQTVPTSSGSATVTADATPHTKGAWTEIIASNSAETTALFIQVTSISVSNTATPTLLDIGIGASGSETAIAENIAVGAAGSIGITWLLAAKIAAGVRISTRTQALIPSDTAAVTIDSFAMGDGSPIPATVDVLGTTTATSSGTSIGATYTEVVASTSQEYKAIVLVASSDQSRGYNDTITIDVAVGGIGNETDVAQTSCYHSTQELIYTLPWSSQITQTTIAAGSRLSAKRSAASRDPDLTIIGIPAA